MADCDVHAPKRPRLDSDKCVKTTVSETASEDAVQEESSSASNPKVFETEVAPKSGPKPVQETDVGITEYISNHEGFQGIIKQRYSDFLVNEIDLSGRKIVLSDIDKPTCDNQEEPVLEDETVFTDGQLSELKQLSQGSSQQKEVAIEAGNDKQKRSLIHEAIRKQFPHLESRTENKNDVKFIVVFKSNSQGSQYAGRQKRHDPWTHPGTDYCHFVLYKENKDTMDAINVISKYLGVKPNMLTYAGNKDKRAKTCQDVSVYRVTASRLHALNRKLRGMALGSFRYCKKPLKLGDLKGNHFVIVLRSVTGSEEQITQAMNSLKDTGFINYFGMQRFGTSSIPTHLVGRALVKSSWQEAIEFILKPREGASDEVSSARQSWWVNRNPLEALRLLGRHQGPERHLLNGLRNKKENDRVGAIGFIPRNTRLMYVHAYQSYLWNSLVSRRIHDYGLKPVIGDLVIPGELTITPEDIASDEGTESATAEEDTIQEKTFIEPFIVTEDNISEYSIHDVVMPLPGYDVMLPKNDTGDWYTELLALDGLLLVDLKHKVKDYALRGTYRKILVKPVNLTWQTSVYDDPFIPLVLGDLEKLQGASLPDNTDGKHKALRLELTLPSSTYATMAIREVLKEDTSAARQSKLTADNRAEVVTEAIDS